MSMAGDAEMSGPSSMHDQSPASRHLAWSPEYGSVREMPRMSAQHRPTEHGERLERGGSALGLSLAPQHFARSGGAAAHQPRKLDESASDSGDETERRSNAKQDASPTSPSHRFTHGGARDISVQSLLAQPSRQASH